MIYTDDEIRDSFRKAQDKKAQVRVLAELNGTDVETMGKKLVELGLIPAPPAPKVPPFDEARAMELYNEGLCDLDIAEMLGVSVQTFSIWRRNHNLPSNRKPGSGTAPGSRRKTKAKSIDELKASPPVSAPAPEPLPDAARESGSMTVACLLDILSDFARRYPDAKVYLDGLRVPEVRMSVLCAPGCAAEAEIYLLEAEAAGDKKGRKQ